MFAVNLHSAFYLIRGVVPGMKARGRGSIIALGGQSSITGRSGTAAVTAAKTGLLGLVRVLDDETDTGPVRVSGLQPPPMRTNIRSRAFVEEAASRVPGPARYANACVHLLSAAGAPWRGEILHDEAVPTP